MQSIFIFSHSGVNVIVNTLRIFILANILSELEDEHLLKEEESDVRDESLIKLIYPICY